MCENCTGEAKPIGQLPSDQIMRLDVVLPLRDPAGLEAFLKELYDPASPSYRHFLTVPEFTERFGPTQEDYDAVTRFAKADGFEVVGGSRDGMEVQIEGPVSEPLQLAPTITIEATGGGVSQTTLSKS